MIQRLGAAACEVRRPRVIAPSVPDAAGLISLRQDEDKVWRFVGCAVR
ncbi:hypothetical protein J7E49_22855 [Variovorax paradoxus]|nr:hypothetical protein [Variovorax paradoxus]